MNIKLHASTAPVQAGDVYGKTPIYGALRVFIWLNYAASLFNFRRTLIASKMRKYNIADVAAAAVN